MSSYETMEIVWKEERQEIEVSQEKINEIIRFGGYLARRGIISNSFGNIAIRGSIAFDDREVVYTKRRGVSLETMDRSDVVITGMDENYVVWGEGVPSNGHQMNRALLRTFPQYNAVIHTHPDIVIGFFSQRYNDEFKFISVDTALVLGAPPKILSKDINLENNPTNIGDIVGQSTCFVMPNHGLTTLGRDVEEAYHRHTSFISEIHRILYAETTLGYNRDNISFVSDETTNQLYKLGDSIIYGK